MRFLTQNQRILFKNMSWLMTASLFRVVAGFFVTASVARYFGPEDFGAFSYAVAFFGFFETFVNVVHTSIVRKWLIEKKELTNTIMGSAAIGLFLVWAVASSVLLFLLWGLDIEEGIKRQILTILVAGFFFRVFDVLVFWLDANMLSGLYGKIEIFSVISFSILRLTIIALNLDLIYLASSMVLQAFLNFVVLYYFFRKTGPKISNWSFSFAVLKRLVVGSAALLVTALSGVVYYKIDQVMLSHMINDSSVGLYTAALKLCEPWQMFSGIIIQVSFGSLIAGKAAGSNPELYALRFGKVLSFLTWSALLLSISYFFLADFLVTIVFSKAYIDAVPIIHILIWGTLFQFWNAAQAVWDVAENLTHFTFLRTFMAAILNTLLNFILIPHFGAVGSAAATVIAIITASIVVNLLYHRTREFLKMELKSFLFWNYLPHQKI